MAEEEFRGLAIQCTGTALHRGVCQRAIDTRMEKHNKGQVTVYVIFSIAYMAFAIATERLTLLRVRSLITYSAKPLHPVVTTVKLPAS